MIDKLMIEYEKKFNRELNKTGIFWAFNNEQFDSNKTHKDAPTNEYLTIGSGGYIHISNKNKLDNFFKVTVPKLQKELTDKIDMDELIEYELNNYECYYIADYSLAVASIKDFYRDIPTEDIIKKVKNIYDLTKDKYLEKNNI